MKTQSTSPRSLVSNLRSTVALVAGSVLLTTCPAMAESLGGKGAGSHDASMPASNARSAASQAEHYVLLSLEQSEAGNVEEAIRYLELAAEIAPEDPRLWFKIADFHFHQKNMNEAFFFLRKALALEPDNPKYVEPFESIWGAVTDRGFLNTGTPFKKMLEALGEPDESYGHPGKGQVVYGYMMVDIADHQVVRVLNMKGLTTDLLTPSEEVDHLLNMKKWTQVYHYVGVDQELKTFVASKDLEAGAEVSTSLTFRRIPSLAHQAALDKVQSEYPEMIKADHPGANIQVFGQDESSFLVFVERPKSTESAAEHALIKIMKGKDDYMLVQYASPGQHFEEEEFEFWKLMFSTAKLKAAGK